jgi:hypothetical protein
MSFFDEVETTVANTRFLQAVEDTGPPQFELTDFKHLVDTGFEARVREQLTLRALVSKPVGAYLFRCFVIKRCEGKASTTTASAAAASSASPVTADSATTEDPLRGLCLAMDEYEKSVEPLDRRRKGLRVFSDYLDGARRASAHLRGGSNATAPAGAEYKLGGGNNANTANQSSKQPLLPPGAVGGGGAAVAGYSSTGSSVPLSSAGAGAAPSSSAAASAPLGSAKDRKTAYLVETAGPSSSPAPGAAGAAGVKPPLAHTRSEDGERYAFDWMS